MEYSRLDFDQYFTDTSNDWCGHTGKIVNQVNYKNVHYEYDGIEYDATYDVLYDEGRNCIQVHFQGSNGAGDWVTNFLFVAKYYDSFVDPKTGKRIQLRVHMGWARMYQAMKHIIRDSVQAILKDHPEAEVEVIGWSLGSAMAQLCVQDLNYNFGIQSHLFTYGSVNPWKMKHGVRRKTKKYLRSCCKEYYNFSHKSDIVTYVVPWIFGFRKIKRVNLGVFKFFGLFNPMVYHCEYWKHDLYEGIE
jgi:hypothetical protein